MSLILVTSLLVNASLNVCKNISGSLSKNSNKKEKEEKNKKWWLKRLGAESLPQSQHSVKFSGHKSYENGDNSDHVITWIISCYCVGHMIKRSSDFKIGILLR